MAVQRTAWIAGASGLVGSALAPLLAGRPEYGRIVSLVRRTGGFASGRVEEAAVDFARLEDADLPPCEDVFCSIGTTIRKAGSKEAFRRVDAGIPAALARRAIAGGAKRFLLVSSVAGDPNSPNFYLRVKAEAESAVALEPFESVTNFRPSFLDGPRAEFRLGERLAIPAAKAFAFVLFGPMRIYRAIPAETVARAMIASALQDGPGRRILHFDAIREAAARLGPAQPRMRVSRPAHSRSRSTNFWILPVAVLGNSPNSTCFGAL